MPPAAVATPTAADVCNDDMKDILNDIICTVCFRTERPTDLWLRLGNLVQNCSPSTLEEQSLVGYTALFLAAMCRQPLICSLLLARGANVKIGPRKGRDDGLLILVAGWESERCIWDDDDACSPAMTAEAEVVRVLISAGVDVDVQDDRGYTPLMLASQKGHAEVVETLLAAPGERLGWEKSGVLVMNGNESPLIMAAREGHLGVVKVLFRPEFRPRVLCVPENDRGVALGRFARERGFDELAEFLEGFAWDKIA